MDAVLIVAEHDHRNLHANTARCVSFARSFRSGRIDIAVLAESGGSIAAQAAALEAVDRVLLLDDSLNRHTLAATWAPQIAALADDYGYVFAPSSTFGKDLMPRVAALLGVGQLSDVMCAEGPRRFQRPIYAGNAILSVECPADSKLVATVRSASFEPVAAGGPAPIEAVSIEITAPTHTRFRGLEVGQQRGPDLQTAARVVSGGRGLGGKENFELVRQLATALDAAVGASRAAVDAGYVANDLQVGQTGKIIAPALYLAVGISGAIQHVTGIKDAGAIVAINKDADAPIFDVADIGLVADLFTAVPELADKLQARHKLRSS